MDELDNYVCTMCGHSSETCNCASEEETKEYLENGYIYDGTEDDDYDNDYEEDDDDFVCFLNGEPLLKSQIDDLLI